MPAASTTMRSPRSGSRAKSSRRCRLATSGWWASSAFQAGSSVSGVPGIRPHRCRERGLRGWATRNRPQRPQAVDRVLTARHGDRHGAHGLRRCHVQRRIADHVHARRLHDVVVQHRGALDGRQREPRSIGRIGAVPTEQEEAVEVASPELHPRCALHRARHDAEHDAGVGEPGEQFHRPIEDSVPLRGRDLVRELTQVQREDRRELTLGGLASYGAFEGLARHDGSVSPASEWESISAGMPCSWSNA